MSLHAQSDDDAVMSRGCSSPIAGKRTEPAKTSLTASVKADFQRLWSGQGYLNESDAIRDLIEIATYGRERLVSLRDQQLRALTVNSSGTGPEQEPGARQ